MQPTITDPGDLMTKGRNERAQIQEQACRLARKDDEATKTSNWVLVEGLFISILLS